MAIVEDDIERVRASTSIVEVVQQYVALRRVGRNWVGLCPFHAEKSGSFNVREDTGRYKCFGCQAAGDVFTFVQEIDHVDFVASVEKLASRSGITLHYTSGGEGKDRQRRKQLVEALEAAVEWYHQRLLTAPDARAARDYLRSRGLAGDTARQFRLGWAPDDWDQLSSHLRKEGVAADVLNDTGLAFANRTGRLQDAFRARVMFPIFTDTGEAVAFGGRILPGSTDPAKYKNSPETKVYFKSKTLYGLNWAKGDVVKADQVVVCEGYTDVIGFHRSGVTRAVATCGTALTEDHVRLIKRFANNVVLAFDADAAGQGAAERFYEWERKLQVSVKVASFSGGKDPGELADTDPEGLVESVREARTFLSFRMHRVIDTTDTTTPEGKERALVRVAAIIREHPSDLVRSEYAADAARRLDVDEEFVLERVAQRGAPASAQPPAASSVTRRENAEFIVLVLMVNDFDAVTSIVSEEVFADESHRRVFRALFNNRDDFNKAEAELDPDAREILSAVLVASVDGDPRVEGVNLLRAAVRRELSKRAANASPEVITRDQTIRLQVDKLLERNVADSDITDLLAWLYEVQMTVEA